MSALDRDKLRLVQDEPGIDAAEPGSRPRVAVWGRYPAMRAGIRALLAEAGLEPVSDIVPGEPAMPAVDVVVADAGEDLPSALAALALEAPGVPVVVLAEGSEDYEAVAGAAAIPAGWLLRDTTAEELAVAVRAVARGLVVLDPEAATVAPRGFGRAADIASRLPPGEALTEREQEVLRLMALGLPNKTIALRLGISEHTAKYHVGEILGKLDASSRTEAVTAAVRRGMLAL